MKEAVKTISSVTREARERSASAYHIVWGSEWEAKDIELEAFLLEKLNSNNWRIHSALYG